MADLDNGKVEHPLTLGPKHWEGKEGVCVHICVCVCGPGVYGGRGRLGKKDSLHGLQWHTHLHTHLLK